MELWPVHSAAHRRRMRCRISACDRHSDVIPFTRASLWLGEVLMPPFVRTLFEAILGLVIIAVVWVLLAGTIGDPAKLPSLPAVLQKAVELAPSDAYLSHFGDSGTALLAGLL